MPKALISGAGIGGLTAAIALKQQGWDIAIYEQHPHGAITGAGISLWPNAIAALDSIGVGSAIRSHGISNKNGGIRHHRGGLLASTSSDDLTKRYGHPTVVIHRAELHTLLCHAFEVPIHYGHSVIQYQQHTNQVTIRCDTSHTDTGDILIVADGIHSHIRKQWFPAHIPRYVGYTAWRGVCTFDHQRIHDYWGEILGYGTRFGITPLAHNQVYWYATHNQPSGHIIPLHERNDYVRTLFDDWAGPIRALIQATPQGSILQHDIFDLPPLPYWVDGRVALLGDAAHAMSPNLGQGGCQAIEDAITLATALSQIADIPDALTTYQYTRKRYVEEIVKQSFHIGRVLTLSTPWQCWLRNLILAITPASITQKSLDPILAHDATHLLRP